ncbi:MarR family winged helix-turn-helix transcriptional regulator [Erysipelothrix rhusiopathiae]|uniref:MarR family winged helix-turn-helix transcriptional regulator n=1 Tax=Erysipelothrix rhusiopathiae TaxID=1648 RepID=UPI001EE0688F|nr:MarR family winged helix-turn-helix transcriptional regulator [Erysipelothrix rhusiopathiae]MCG4457451.1 MarR family winged helix-turn-helix transcriptional regulator [Erysipelothrix rhusiopathiae]MDE8040514.1 MarR family winged helix-turn-helix transcriptional regulator [Erysipelothrix rhusiopathiae]MDE8042098.1 MarR family winged helix-turn-helix transcriptional regulator [Erysipelothrix rhusiopathiae]MDE8050348.1 MarR family winged helix-turn-helix transcriptional regulator [Erysipelothri
MTNLKTLTILFRTHQNILEKVKESIKDFDINVNEFQALEALYHKGKLTTQALCDTVLVPGSSMTYVVDQLEKKGLVVRLKDEKDRRINYVMLSPKGLNDTEIIYNKHYEEMRKRFDKLTSEEEVTLQILLKKIGKEG